MAPSAILRPFQRRSRSARSVAERTSVAPDSGQIGHDLFAGATDVVGKAIDLDQEHRAGVHRVAGVIGRLDGLDGEVVHHLQRGRHDAGGDDARRGVGRRLDVGKWRSRTSVASGVGVSRTIALVTMPSVPSEPTTAAGEVVAGRRSSGRRSRRFRPSGRTISRPRTWFVVTPYLRQWGPPAFSATLPPMVQAFWLDGSGAKKRPGARVVFRELEVDDAGLDERGAVFAVDLEDAVHARQADDDPALLGTAPPERPVPAPAGNDRQPSLASQDNDFRHLLRCRWQGDGARRCGLHSTVDATVVLVDEQVGRAREDRVSAEDVPQLFDQRFAIHDGSHHSVCQVRRSRREKCQ